MPEYYGHFSFRAVAKIDLKHVASLDELCSHRLMHSSNASRLHKATHTHIHTQFENINICITTLWGNIKHKSWKSLLATVYVFFSNIPRVHITHWGRTLSLFLVFIYSEGCLNPVYLYFTQETFFSAIWLQDNSRRAEYKSLWLNLFTLKGQGFNRWIQSGQRPSSD